MSTASRLLQRQPWLVPLAFAIAFGVVGWSTVRALAAHERSMLGSELESTLRTSVEALSVWVKRNEATVQVYVEDPRVAAHLAELARVARTVEDPATALRAAPEQQRLRELLDPVARIHGFRGWGAQDLTGLMIANLSDDQVGFRPQAIASRRLEVVNGLSIQHTAPMYFDIPGETLVLMIVGGPVADPDGRLVATLGFSIDPTESFSRILESARVGSSGETYAFDAEGVMVSTSRFEDQLRDLGLLASAEEGASALRIQIRDPGGNMLDGFEPSLPMRARSFTVAAASAIAGETSRNLEGYPDYRGVPVIGAWTWVPSLRIGIASEIDEAEAYAGLRDVSWRLGLMFALLGVATLGMAGYSWTVRRLQGKVDDAVRLGRYRVDRKIGKGGMGTVYLARHALLRRPTAIKVLEKASADPEALTRFEREVQVSSSLSHPNTIEIYDYGHSAEGDFYYAMEYVGGIDLAMLVDKDGPQPAARVRSIMSQAAGSVAEAHARGLIHRDIKPANIMICERGGIRDFVKVLDFGLVRSRERREDLSITRTQALTGTPLYMAPEALEDPTQLDARGDVYQLGAVAYFLLVGRPPFEGHSVVEVLSKHMNERPTAPEEILGEPVAPALVEVILRSLEKSPADRFVDARAMLQALGEAEIDGHWTQDDAEAWWSDWELQHPEGEAGSTSSGSGSTPSGYVIDLLGSSRSRSRGS